MTDKDIVKAAESCLNGYCSSDCPLIREYTSKEKGISTCLAKFCEFIIEKSKQCEDQAKFHPVDEFKCSACGIHLAEWVRKETDEETGDVTNHEYEPQFCPNCGREIRR